MKQFILIALLIGFSYSQGFHKRMMGGDGHREFPTKMMMNPEMLNEAGVSTEQITRIKSIQSNSEKEFVQLEADLKVLNIEKKELMDSENQNLAKIEDKVKSIHDLQAKIEIKRIKVMSEIKKVLSKEQQAKLKEMRKNRSGMGRKGRMKRDF